MALAAIAAKNPEDVFPPPNPRAEMPAPVEEPEVLSPVMTSLVPSGFPGAEGVGGQSANTDEEISSRPKKETSFISSLTYFYAAASQPRSPRHSCLNCCHPRKRASNCSPH